MEKMKLLIDTDPGVDDALAIMLAHARAEVVGLTIAAGNVGLAHTVANALKLVETIGADTPVFAGCANPLVLPAADAAFVHGNDGFGDTGYAPSTRAVENEHAVDAILRLSHEHAGKLVIASIAPMTNIAMALRRDPTLPERVAQLVVMGGAVTGRGNTHLVPAEFNVGFDPEAAHVVFSTWPRVHARGLGIDHASRSRIRHARTMARQRKRDRAFLRHDFREDARVDDATRPRRDCMVADALALAVVLEPDIVRRAEHRHVAVELNGTLTRGATVVDWDRRLGRRENARIVMDVDQARFESLIGGTLAR